MRARFYLPGIVRTGQTVSLKGEELHHLRKVLRLEAGEEIGLFDGEGRSFSGRILELSGGEARVELGAEDDSCPESRLRLVLLAALSKGERFEWVVQKATELGVSEIRPVLTRRGEVRPVAGREGRKAERWRRVALEACKQSGRSRIPTIHDPEDLETALGRPWPDRKVVLDPEGSAAAWEAFSPSLSPATGLVLAVGPEGGWSPEEKESFRAGGFTALRLGPRTLRTETAAIVSTAIFQFLAGDLGGGGGEGHSRGDNALKTKV